MAKILILEDDLERTKIFQKNLIGHEVCIIDTVAEAIQKLKEEDWTDLFLDHDLGGKVMVPSGPETGWEVAKWLSENPERQPNQIILHTFNGPGRANMKALLPQAIEAPGVWLTLKEEKNG